MDVSRQRRKSISFSGVGPETARSSAVPVVALVFTVLVFSSPLVSVPWQYSFLFFFCWFHSAFVLALSYLTFATCFNRGLSSQVVYHTVRTCSLISVGWTCPMRWKVPCLLAWGLAHHSHSFNEGSKQKVWTITTLLWVLSKACQDIPETQGRQYGGELTLPLPP